MEGGVCLHDEADNRSSGALIDVLVGVGLMEGVVEGKVVILRVARKVHLYFSPHPLPTVGHVPAMVDK